MSIASDDEIDRDIRVHAHLGYLMSLTVDKSLNGNYLMLLYSVYFKNLLTTVFVMV